MVQQCLVRLAAVVPMLLAASAHGEMLMLLQNLPVDQAGTRSLLLDRTRIVLVRARQEKGQGAAVEVVLATQPPMTTLLRCVDRAAADQLVDFLRAGGPGILDVTARCRF